MRSRWIVLSLTVVMLVAIKGLQAANEAKEFKATCPVARKPAGESHVVELKNGDKVYFCCDNCPKAFKANQGKFTEKVNAQLLETGQVAQVACPLTGKPVNKEVTVEARGSSVGLCCKGCLAKFDKADEDGKDKLLFSNAALKKGFTRQTTCPVSGKPINAEHVVEFKNQKVYFCCENCPTAFEKEPDKFLAKLPQFNKGKKTQ